MPDELLNSPRRFRIWEYTVGHKQLLLRSTKDPGLSTRIDVLFKNVAAIHLCTSLDGLTISKVADGENIDPPLGIRPEILDGMNLYIVRGAGFTGYVIAGVMGWHEDEGEYHDRSYFQIWPN